MALVFRATARVGVHGLSLRLPYLGIFPFTLLHLTLDFIRVSSLRPTYTCTHSVDPSLTHFLDEFTGLGLALVPDVVVPDAEQGCAWTEISIQISALAGVEPRTLESSGQERYH